MQSIAFLPTELVDQIAAGEVVERPSSVVKELVENALDAGASTIRVEIERGGTTSIRVIDDGSGMGEADVLLAVQRHATSKLRHADDLDRIATMGFRGEALPSMASVSRFTIRTRTRENDAGVELRIVGAGPPELVPVGMPVGTSVAVEELFFNVPARRKFLKSLAVEGAHVSEVVLRTALARPDVRFVLVRDGRTLRDLPAVEHRRDRARAVIDEPRLDEIEGERDGVRVHALLAPPERARAGATQLQLFVNRRPVRDRGLARAVSFAFGSVMPPGRYPVGAVWLELAPERVDVNVHPQKLEVRFDEPRPIFDAVTRLLAGGLGRAPFRPSIRRDAGFWEARWAAPSQTTSEPPAEPRASGERTALLDDAWGLVPIESGAASEPPARDTDRELGEPSAWLGEASQPTARYRSSRQDPPTLRDAPRLDDDGVAVLTARPSDGGLLPGLAEGDPPLRVLGQARRLFIVCEAREGLVVLDQHAADERIRFAALRESFDTSGVRMQRLLLPERIPLSASELEILRAHGDDLARLGIEAEALDDTTAILRGVPALLGRAQPVAVLRDLLAELARTGSRAFGDRVDMVLATVACHGALRAGDALSQREMEELVVSLGKVASFASHCPHGRPVIATVPFAELLAKVGR